MITDEGMARAAARMQEAADRMDAAAYRMETAVQRLAVMTEDGYGGNVPKLIELLEHPQAPPVLKV